MLGSRCLIVQSRINKRVAVSALAQLALRSICGRCATVPTTRHRNAHRFELPRKRPRAEFRYQIARVALRRRRRARREERKAQVGCNLFVEVKKRSDGWSSRDMRSRRTGRTATLVRFGPRCRTPCDNAQETSPCMFPS